MLKMMLATVMLSVAFPMGSALADHQATLETNKKVVTAFYNAALNEKDFDLAKSYIGKEGYKQHNPNAKDGAEGLRGFIDFLKDRYPDNRSEIKRIFAEGDFVIVHVHAIREPGTRGNAIVDIFRMDADSKIVEHWDVAQPIPETAQNDNGMF
ncbi:nuclear transport factor 2 family protein [Ectopseudomonas khazarica]|uniref:nuclear transport factor 2 family protein n=1 Tax=Ectopseudomonas khazarica TaxID=2502979 RepID=UPI004034AF17